MADNPCCAGTFLFLLGLFFIYGATQKYLLAQKIRNTPTSRVRSAAVGLVELFGKARCREAMLSPISQAKCAYWRLHCEYYQPGKHGGWRDLYRQSSSTQFYLEDETGKMLIEPKGAEIDIPADFSSTGYLKEGGVFGFFKNRLLDKKVLDFLERDEPAKRAFNSRSGYELRATEFFIAEGDPLYVLGSAQPLKEASSAVAHENLVVKLGSDNIMHISDTQESNVVAKAQGSVWWMLILGFVLSAIGLIILLYQVFKLG